MLEAMPPRDAHQCPPAARVIAAAPRLWGEALLLPFRHDMFTPFQPRCYH